MKVYVDILFLINFFFDFLLLLTVSILLKRNVSWKRVLLGAIAGGSSIFILFIDFHSVELFLLKLVISVLMVWITFSFKNLNYMVKNLAYLYLVSIILGGFLYFLNVQFSYQQEGIVFYHNGFSPNIIMLLILTPFVLFYYIFQHRQLQKKYSLYYKVDIYLKNHQKLKLNGFLDTGNRLYDPYFHRPVVMIEEKALKNYPMDDYILVEANTITKKSLIKCFEIDKLKIEGVGEFENILLGVMQKSLNMEGINCILHYKLLEG